MKTLYYVVDPNGTIHDDHLTIGKARERGRDVVKHHEYAAIFRHGPESDPTRYDRKPMECVRPTTVQGLAR